MGTLPLPVIFSSEKESASGARKIQRKGFGYLSKVASGIFVADSAQESAGVANIPSASKLGMFVYLGWCEERRSPD